MTTPYTSRESALAAVNVARMLFRGDCVSHVAAYTTGGYSLRIMCEPVTLVSPRPDRWVARFTFPRVSNITHSTEERGVTAEQAMTELFNTLSGRRDDILNGLSVMRIPK